VNYFFHNKLNYY